MQLQVYRLRHPLRGRGTGVRHKASICRRETGKIS